LKAEWLYVDLGKTTNTNLHSLSNRSGLLAATVNTTRHDFHTVRAGLNYRFNWGGAPVVARY
jgi:outer membrane immunogenic protein